MTFASSRFFGSTLGTARRSIMAVRWVDNPRASPGDTCPPSSLTQPMYHVGQCPENQSLSTRLHQHRASLPGAASGKCDRREQGPARAALRGGPPLAGQACPEGGGSDGSVAGLVWGKRPITAA